jgi:butirosin biosynthesis protein H-like
MTTTYQPSAGLPGIVHVAGPIQHWCRDLVSCLQATFATVLAHAGHDPLEALGAHWEFRYRPGDVRTEEFYYPCAVPGDLAASLAPHHPLSSSWRQPADGTGRDPAATMAEIIAALAAGNLVIAAVDNFYLPFRPAFGDVHAAHLLVVFGVDLVAGQVHVSDAMPPAFRGPIPVADFIRAWSSANPADEQDVFFSSARIDRRFMTVTIGEPFPVLDRPMLRTVLAANLAGYLDPTSEQSMFKNKDLFETGRPGAHGTDWLGFGGLDRFLGALLEASAGGDVDLLAQTYPFGWGMQAQASLHAELLRRCGAQAGLAALCEAARLVEATAHAWTGLRMTAAHGIADPAACARDLARHAARLRRCYDLALASLEEAVELL